MSVSLKDLLVAAQAGDKRAYRNFLEQVVRMISPFLTRRLNSKDDTQDVIQDVLMGIHSSLSNYCSDYEVSPWVYSIASRKLNTYLKKKYKRNECLIDTDDLAAFLPSKSNMETRFEDLELVEHIKDAMLSLKPKQKQVMELLKVQEYSVTEIAERLNISVSDVKVTAHRGYGKVKDYLKRKYGYAL